MLIRRHLPNGRSIHGETIKPLIFKGLTGKYRECAQRLNYRPLYTICTDNQSVTRSVLESRTWKQEKTNRNTTAYCVENQRFAEAKTTVLNNGSNSVPELCSYLIISVLDALHRKVGRKNKRKQIGTLRHIALRISDLQKQNHRFQQRSKLCSCIVFISDYQRVRCSVSEIIGYQK